MGLSAIGYLTISVSISLHRSSCSAIHLLFFIFLWFHFKDSTRFLLSLAPPRGQVVSWVSGSCLPAVLGISQVMGWRGGDGMDPAGGKALQETRLEKAWARNHAEPSRKTQIPVEHPAQEPSRRGSPTQPGSGSKTPPFRARSLGLRELETESGTCPPPALGCPLPACLLRTMVSHFPMGSRCREARRRRSQSSCLARSRAPKWPSLVRQAWLPRVGTRAPLALLAKPHGIPGFLPEGG